MPPPHHVLISTQRGGGSPLLIMFFPFRHGKEGYTPSPLCSFHFNTTRRVYPLPIVLFPFQRDEEGYAPSSSCSSYFDATRSGLAPAVLFPFRHNTKGRYTPSSLCCSYFDMMGRCTPPHHVGPVSTRWGGGLPLLVAFIPISTWREGVCPSPLCFSYFDATRRECPSCCSYFNTALFSNMNVVIKFVYYCEKYMNFLISYLWEKFTIYGVFWRMVENSTSQGL